MPANFHSARVFFALTKLSGKYLSYIGARLSNAIEKWLVPFQKLIYSSDATWQEIIKILRTFLIIEKKSGSFDFILSVFTSPNHKHLKPTAAYFPLENIKYYIYTCAGESVLFLTDFKS